MTSERLPADWCFLGSHVMSNLSERITMKADYYCCMRCYVARVEDRSNFLRGQGKRKADSDSDSESHPNPEPKKVSAAPLAPASSSSSSSPLLSGVTVCPSNESLFKKLELLSKELASLRQRQTENWARMDYLSSRIDTTSIKSGDLATRVAKCEGRLDKHDL